MTIEQPVTSLCEGEGEGLGASELMVPASVYEAAVKGRQDFRNAYRALLPVLRAAEELSRLWRTNGQKINDDAFLDAINAVDVSVSGGKAKPSYLSARLTDDDAPTPSTQDTNK